MLHLFFLNFILHHLCDYPVFVTLCDYPVFVTMCDYPVFVTLCDYPVFVTMKNIWLKVNQVKMSRSLSVL